MTGSQSIRPDNLFAPLLRPIKLLSRPDVLAKPCPVRNAAGLYAWYFKQVPPGVPFDDCHRHVGLTLPAVATVQLRRRKDDVTQTCQSSL